MAGTAALGLSGCIHTAAPEVAARPANELDAMAYGQPSLVAQAGVAATPAGPDPGGAIGALRGRLAGARRPDAAPVNYAVAPPQRPYDGAYRLDAGDKLRVVVFGQDGLTNSYAIDAGGAITMPLIGAVPARGQTPASLAAEITGRLRRGYIREPSVAVEIESYRPFFILGEVAAPGQYAYVPNMSVESAVAIAGGFSPRARRDTVTLTHTDEAGALRSVVPLGTAINPGDTVLVGERWF